MEESLLQFVFAPSLNKSGVLNLKPSHLPSKHPIKCPSMLQFQSPNYKNSVCADAFHFITVTTYWLHLPLAVSSVAPQLSICVLLVLNLRGGRGTYIRTLPSSPAEANIWGLVGFHETELQGCLSCPGSISIICPFSLCQI